MMMIPATTSSDGVGSTLQMTSLPAPKSPTTEVAHPKITEANSTNTPHAPSRAINAIDLTTVTDEEEIKNHDGHIWECTGRTLIPGEGYIYEYRLREEYSYKKTRGAVDAFHRKTGEIFPAIEIQPGQRLGKSEQTYKYLTEFGYKTYENSSEIFLELPDQDVLLARWKVVKESHSPRGDLWNQVTLKIAASENIAGDEEFVEAYFTHDVLLSTGKEFVHDHLSHVISTLEFLRSPESYLKSREALANKIKNVRKDIDCVKQWVENSLKTPPNDLNNEEGRKYLARLQNNLRYASVIPGIITDACAAAGDLLESFRTFSAFKGFDETKDVIRKRYSDYLSRTLPSKITAAYKKTHGVEITEEVLAADLADISIPWFCGEIATILKRIAKK